MSLASHAEMTSSAGIADLARGEDVGEDALALVLAASPCG